MVKCKNCWRRPVFQYFMGKGKVSEIWPPLKACQKEYKMLNSGTRVTKQTQANAGLIKVLG